MSGSPGHESNKAVCPPTAAQVAAGQTCSVMVIAADQQSKGAQPVFLKALLTVEPKVPTPGVTTVTLAGKYFACATVANGACARGELVHLYLNNVLIGGVNANTDGTFQLTLPMPSGFGKFTYKAVGVTSGLIATSVFSNMPS